METVLNFAFYLRILQPFRILNSSLKKLPSILNASLISWIYMFLPIKPRGVQIDDKTLFYFDYILVEF